MSLNALGELLPTLYAKWAAEFLGGPVPREERATCNACVMCSREGQETLARSPISAALSASMTSFAIEMTTFLAI
jgi:hypothetical protein